MQFACENCKTQLQIADDKVRGKRLIVRCKRCGAKIAIADPALGGSSGPRLVSAGFPAARSAPQQRPAQSHPSQGRPAPGQNGRPRDTDIESTRAMESDVLEKALRASKQDAAAQNGEPQAEPTPEPDAQQAPVAAPDDEALWFAMLHGNQTGPLTRAELTGRANAGEVGPRTYLWRDGMDAWQRAKDVSELAFLFPKPAPARPSAPRLPSPSSATPPAPSAPRPEAPQAQAAANDAPQPAALAAPDDRLHHDDVARDLFTPGETPAVHKTPADLARWASEELAKKRHAAEPKEAPPSRMFEGAAPPQSRGPFGLFVVLLALAVAAAILWTALGPKDKPVEARPDAGEGQAAPAADAGKAAAAEPPARREEPPAPSRASAAPALAPVVGLTNEQVHEKLDEHKPALQACVDEAVRRNPHLSLRRIKISTTVAPSGRVTSAHINSRAVEEAPLGACLRKATRKIVFPPFRGEPFDVDIPIVLSGGN